MHLGEEDEYIMKDARETVVAARAGNACGPVRTYPGPR